MRAGTGRRHVLPVVQALRNQVNQSEDTESRIRDFRISRAFTLTTEQHTRAREFMKANKNSKVQMMLRSKNHTKYLLAAYGKLETSADLALISDSWDLSDLLHILGPGDYVVYACRGGTYHSECSGLDQSHRYRHTKSWGDYNTTERTHKTADYLKRAVRGYNQSFGFKPQLQNLMIPPRITIQQNKP